MNRKSPALSQSKRNAFAAAVITKIPPPLSPTPNCCCWCSSSGPLRVLVFGLNRRVVSAGYKVAAMGRKVSVPARERTGMEVVRRERREMRREGEGVVRWEGVRVVIEVRRVWVFEGGGGGGVDERGSTSSSVGSLFSCSCSGGAEGGGERGRVDCSKFERRRDARAGMVIGLYISGRRESRVWFEVMVGVGVLDASSTMALRTEKRDETRAG